MDNMENNKDKPSHPLNALHLVLVVAIIVLWALTIYNYIQDGKFNYISIIISLVALTLIALQRSSLKIKSGS
jgi:hypothetical protein